MTATDCKHSGGNSVEASRIGSSSNRPRIVLFLTFLTLAAGAAAYWYWPATSEPARAKAPARPAVPVSVAVVRAQDQPVYVTGLGTVLASQIIRIHTQVEGKLQSVLFTEGQHVKKGDVLATIDPR